MPPDSDPIARNINKEDFEKICRSCLCENDLTDIFELVFQGTLFSDIVYQLFEIELSSDDDLPKNICPNCVNKVAQFYTFKERFNDSQVILEAILNPKSKSPEVEDVGTVTLRDESSTPETASSEDETEENASKLCNSNETASSEDEEEENASKLCNNNISQEEELQVISDTNIEKEAEESAGQDSEYIDHRKEINEELQGNQFDCNLCLMRFSTKSGLKLHCSMKHTKKKIFLCEYCGKGFIQKKNLIDHRSTHSGEQPHVCVICNKQFSTADSFKQHKHSKATPFACTICKKAFSDKKLLSKHMVYHNGKKVLCVECGQKFHTKSQLRQHLRVHSGEKPYSCILCSKSFSHQSSLKGHILSHTGERQHTCDICSKSFKRPFELTRHLRTHVPKEPLRCEYCGKRYFRQASLDVHTRIHTLEKPYECDVCSEGFPDFKALKRHKRTLH